MAGWSCAARVMLEYEARRHSVSRGRPKRAASSTGARASFGCHWTGAGGPTRSTATCDPSARPAASTTASVRAAAPYGGTTPSGSRSKSRARQGRVLAVRGAGPPQHRLVAGAGQGDVEQAQVLAAALLDLHLLVAGELVPLVPDIDGAFVGVGRIVEHRDVAGLGVPVPHVGAVDDGELEALAAVDGDDLDGVGVGFEAAGPFLVVGVTFGVVDPPAQPGGQRGRAEAVGDSSLVQELGDVAQVRHEALTRRTVEHTPGDALGTADRFEQRRDPLVAQQCGPAVQATSAGPPTPPPMPSAISVAVQPTKQVSAASAARSRAVGRSRASSRRNQSWAGSVANTEPAPPITAWTPAAWSASRTRTACELSRTSTAMWPWCNVFCSSSLPSRRRTMSLGSAESNATTSAARSEAISRPRLGLAHQTLPWRDRDETVCGVQDPQPEGCRLRRTDEPRVAGWRRLPGSGGRRCRRTRGVRRRRARRRPRATILIAAPVDVERPLGLHGLVRLQVGVDVRAAEGVDRLFGVADQHQGGRAAPSRTRAP